MLISLVENLDKTRYRSLVCLLKDGWLNNQFRQRGFETVIIPQRSGLDLRWVTECVKVLQSRSVDLLHAHEFTMNVYGSMAAWKTGIPIITTVHGKSYYGDKGRRRLAYRLVAKNAFRMVAVSENIKQLLMEKVGIQPTRLATIYNGIDSKRYTSSESSRIREELGISNTAPVVGAVGNLYPVKGHTYLLRAAVHVLRHFPDAIFPIIGRGELLPALQKEAMDLGITNNILFLGFREDIPNLLQTMDIFVLPSLSEGLPLSVLEAMASGKPVVVTRVGGNAEVVSDGETGFLIEPKDPEALASKIILLLKDKSLGHHLGRNGQKRVSEKFSVERMVQSYQQLYENALLQKPVAQ